METLVLAVAAVSWGLIAGSLLMAFTMVLHKGIDRVFDGLYWHYLEMELGLMLVGSAVFWALPDRHLSAEPSLAIIAIFMLSLFMTVGLVESGAWRLYHRSIGLRR
ncbi:hypothetical protein HY374_00415 [Candidatus Berkelbacteria bacterium]|nr:hypothetical protein [Candidatus Berkelbacteria bacterium]